MKQKNIRVMIDEDVWRELRRNAKHEGKVFSFYLNAILCGAINGGAKDASIKKGAVRP